MGDDAKSAFLDRIRDKLMCVEALSVDSNKEGILFYFAAVNYNIGDFSVKKSFISMIGALAGGCLLYTSPSPRDCS